MGGSGRRDDAAHSARRRLSGPARPVCGGMQEGRPQAGRSRSRSFRAPAGDRRACAPRSRADERCGRRRLGRPRSFDFCRLRRSSVRVHPCARLGRRDPQYRHRPRAGHRPLRGRADQASVVAHAARHTRRLDGRPGSSRARRRSAPTTELRARARFLASVLPEAARFTRHRRDRPDRRRRASRRARGRAPDADRRRRSAGGPAGARQGRKEDQRRRAGRLARNCNRPRNRGLTDASSQPPSEGRRSPERPPVADRGRGHRDRRPHPRQPGDLGAPSKRSRQGQVPPARTGAEAGRARRDSGARAEPAAAPGRARRRQIGARNRPECGPLEADRLGSRAARVRARPSRRRLAHEPVGDGSELGNRDGCLGDQLGFVQLVLAKSGRPARFLDRRLHVFPRRRRASSHPARGRARPPAGPAGLERAGGGREAHGHPLQDLGQRPRTGGELVSKKKLPQSAQIAITVAVLLLIALVGYFALVKPEKGKAASLSTQIAEQDKQIVEARALLAKAKNAQKVRVADLFRLTKAMPDQPDEAGIILELTNVAHDSGIAFESIAPQASTVLSGYQAVPITVIFDGNFFQLTDFLFRLRNLVDVRRGALVADGRLFTVDSVQFDEGEQKFPEVRATLTIDAYIYGTGATVSAPPQTSTGSPSTTTTTTTTATTTTPSTTTPASTAAPSPTGGTN